MLRIITPLFLVLLLALSGCDDGNQSDADVTDSGNDASSTPTPSAEVSPSETTEPTPSTGAVTTRSFCKRIRPIITADNGTTRGDAAMKLLSDGLPTDMSGPARSGLQVLVDLSPYFGDMKELFRSYYALGEADKKDVHAFAGYVTTECGTDLLKDLMPTLPDDLVSDLPSELASIIPKR